MWNTPGRRWEKPLDDHMAMSGLGGWDGGVRPAVYFHFILLNPVNLHVVEWFEIFISKIFCIIFDNNHFYIHTVSCILT